MTFFVQDFVCKMLKTGFCPNYFIPSVSLWGAEAMGKEAEKVPSQALLGCEIIQKTMRSDISKIIIPDIFLCEILLEHIYTLPATQFYTLATLLLLLAECAVLCSLPVLCLGMIVTLQTTVSWLLGMITCLPIIIIYAVVLLATKYIITHLHL